jgi:hypothetical protein
MINDADFRVRVEIFWAALCLKTDRTIEPDSTEEPDDQSHQQQGDEIDPAGHRNQHGTEKRAFECALSDSRERRGCKKFLEHFLIRPD